MHEAFRCHCSRSFLFLLHIIYMQINQQNNENCIFVAVTLYVRAYDNMNVNSFNKFMVLTFSCVCTNICCSHLCEMTDDAKWIRKNKRASFIFYFICCAFYFIWNVSRMAKRLKIQILLVHYSMRSHTSTTPNILQGNCDGQCPIAENH